jgi:2'-5' RNA ligase
VSTLRVFTAVELPRATREAVVRTAHTLLMPPESREARLWKRGLAPVPPENLHATVRFLGEVEEERLPEIVAALRDAVEPLPAATARVSGVGAFPGRGRPRVIWCGIDDPDGALTRLEQAASSGLAPLGFPPEDRPYHPHVTLARVRDGRVGRTLSERMTRTGGEVSQLGPLPVDHLAVFQSTLLRASGLRGRDFRGPRYQRLYRLELDRIDLKGTP